MSIILNKQRVSFKQCERMNVAVYTAMSKQNIQAAYNTKKCHCTCITNITTTKN